MALNLSIPQDSGAVASYWKIREIRIHNGHPFPIKRVEIFYDGYISKQAREEGKQPLVEKNVVFDLPSNEDIENNNFFSLLYSKIKELDMPQALDV